MGEGERVPHEPDRWDTISVIQHAFGMARLPTKGKQKPFSLGLPGEYWNDVLKCLVVPVGHVHVVLVSMSSDGKQYTVCTNDNWTDVDSALMAAALVYEVLESYQWK